MTRLAILGGGFMGGALAEGLIDTGWNRSDLVVAEVSAARRKFLVDVLELATTDDPRAAVAHSEIVLVAVKPQDVHKLLDSVAREFRDGDKLVVSICAGVPTAVYETKLGPIPVIRTMPNTPAAIGLGATAIAKGRFANDSHLATALNLLSSVGKVVVVEEDQMDAVTAVSGTGPAYLFYLAEALIDAAQREGLTKEQAYVLVYQTLVGAARLLTHDAAGPEELRSRVTSPGGTTHAAIQFLEQEGWAETFKEAVRRARLRSEELGREG